MGSSPLRPSGRVADLLRRRREVLGLTLHEASRRADARGHGVDAATISRIERGILEPGIRRLHALIGVYGIEPAVASAFAELDLLGASPVSGPVSELRADAEREWKAGNTARALGAILGILQATAEDQAQRLERQRALVFCATIARGLGKISFAQSIIDELLCSSPEESVVIDALILASSLWRERGSLPVAFALIDHASRLVGTEDRKRRPQVLQQKAKLLVESDRADEAWSTLQAALGLYDGTNETLNEARARVLGIAILEKLGRLDEAVAWGRGAVAFAEANDHGFVKTHAFLELGRVLVAAGRPRGAIDELRRALASAVLAADRNAELHAHENLALAFDALGDPVAAKAERARAEALSELVGWGTGPHPRGRADERTS